MKQKLLIFPALLTLAACSPGSGGGAGDKDQVQNTKTEPAFSRNFTGDFLVMSADTHVFQSRSLYSGGDETSLLACSETADGRDFSFEMKNGEPNADHLKIRIRNAYFRPEKENYKDLSSVRFDGYSRNKWFQFKDRQPSLGCEAKVERVRDYVKGFFQCAYLTPSNTNQQIAVVLNFACDVVRK